MLGLLYETPAAWSEAVLADLDAFLMDHASNERKAAQSALVLASHHPRQIALVEAMIGVAEEELAHFREVWALLRRRGLTLPQDAPDPYISRFFKHLHKHDNAGYLRDRLLAFGIVEARGCERFTLVARALPPGELKDFYEDLVKSEARHHALFLRLARELGDPDDVERRLGELLAAEAEVVRGLPIRSALH
ncbi:MAG: tRNA-(ms[2]io[6]A)-hydroxylase [Deltaproteobacteria bacterium]|nr:tRNA-(ms[2]io[6]A)-hydroxylase [Deltaproteobacteria bacterium]